MECEPPSCTSPQAAKCLRSARLPGNQLIHLESIPTKCPGRNRASQFYFIFPRNHGSHFGCCDLFCGGGTSQHGSSDSPGSATRKMSQFLMWKSWTVWQSTRLFGVSAEVRLHSWRPMGRLFSGIQEVSVCFRPSGSYDLCHPIYILSTRK